MKTKFKNKNLIKSAINKAALKEALKNKDFTEVLKKIRL